MCTNVLAPKQRYGLALVGIPGAAMDSQRRDTQIDGIMSVLESVRPCNTFQKGFKAVCQLDQGCTCLGERDAVQLCFYWREHRVGQCKANQECVLVRERQAVHFHFRKDTEQ